MAAAVAAVQRPGIIIPPLKDGEHIIIVDVPMADSCRLTKTEPLDTKVDKTVSDYEKASPEKRLKMVNDMVWAWPLLWLRVRTKLKQRAFNSAKKFRNDHRHRALAIPVVQPVPLPIAAEADEPSPVD
jgi:hypothetical protein